MITKLDSKFKKRKLEFRFRFMSEENDTKKAKLWRNVICRADDVFIQKMTYQVIQAR